ncbi:MAG: hypothetical protein ABH883_03610, partial [Candidatus Omnitrophota bacterium]
LRVESGTQGAGFSVQEEILNSFFIFRPLSADISGLLSSGSWINSIPYAANSTTPQPENDPGWDIRDVLFDFEWHDIPMKNPGEYEPGFIDEKLLEMTREVKKIAEKKGFTRVEEDDFDKAQMTAAISVPESDYSRTMSLNTVYLARMIPFYEWDKNLFIKYIDFLTDHEKGHAGFRGGFSVSEIYNTVIFRWFHNTEYWKELSGMEAINKLVVLLRQGIKINDLPAEAKNTINLDLVEKYGFTEETKTQVQDVPIWRVIQYIGDMYADKYAFEVCDPISIAAFIWYTEIYLAGLTEDTADKLMEAVLKKISAFCPLKKKESICTEVLSINVRYARSVDSDGRKKRLLIGPPGDLSSELFEKFLREFSAEGKTPEDFARAIEIFNGIAEKYIWKNIAVRFYERKVFRELFRKVFIENVTRKNLSDAARFWAVYQRSVFSVAELFRDAAPDIYEAANLIRKGYPCSNSVRIEDLSAEHVRFFIDAFARFFKLYEEERLYFLAMEKLAEIDSITDYKAPNGKIDPLMELNGKIFINGYSENYLFNVMRDKNLFTISVRNAETKQEVVKFLMVMEKANDDGSSEYSMRKISVLKPHLDNVIFVLRHIFDKLNYGDKVKLASIQEWAKEIFKGGYVKGRVTEILKIEETYFVKSLTGHGTIEFVRKEKKGARGRDMNIEFKRAMHGKESPAGQKKESGGKEGAEINIRSKKRVNTDQGALSRLADETSEKEKNMLFSERMRNGIRNDINIFFNAAWDSANAVLNCRRSRVLIRIPVSIIAKADPEYVRNTIARLSRHSNVCVQLFSTGISDPETEPFYTQFGIEKKVFRKEEISRKNVITLIDINQHDGIDLNDISASTGRDENWLLKSVIVPVNSDYTSDISRGIILGFQLIDLICRGEADPSEISVLKQKLYDIYINMRLRLSTDIWNPVQIEKWISGRNDQDLVIMVKFFLELKYPESLIALQQKDWAIESSSFVSSL